MASFQDNLNKLLLEYQTIMDFPAVRNDKDGGADSHTLSNRKMSVMLKKI